MAKSFISGLHYTLESSGVVAVMELLLTVSEARIQELFVFDHDRKRLSSGIISPCCHGCLRKMWMRRLGCTLRVGCFFLWASEVLRASCKIVWDSE